MEETLQSRPEFRDKMVPLVEREGALDVGGLVFDIVDDVTVTLSAMTPTQPLREEHYKRQDWAEEVLSGFLGVQIVFGRQSLECDHSKTMRPSRVVFSLRQFVLASVVSRSRSFRCIFRRRIFP